MARVGRGRGLGVGLLGAAAIICSLIAHPALASEDAANLYLLGSGGPGVAIMPPLKGIFFDSTTYFYTGESTADKTFNFNGHLIANVNGMIAANFATLLFVPTTNLLGGTFAVGPALPFGGMTLSGSAVLTGPLGRQLGFTDSGSAFIVGDPVMMAMWGWKHDNLSIQAATMLNVPIGEYRPDKLINLSFHRWAGDTSLAATWHDDKAGWDVSAKAGFTFNGTNPATQYTTGTEFHLEGAVARQMAKGFWIGGQAYYYDQLTGDSGPGAVLGPFKGRVVGVGATAAHDFRIGKIPGTVRIRGMTEMDAVNRLEGKSAWLDITFPLAVSLPRAAAAQ
jgi:hypothetical protein